jgi:hypothetical protein
MLIAVMVGCAFMILPCTQAPAARWGRELNPQPLPVIAARCLWPSRFGQNACRIFAIDFNQHLSMSIRMAKNVVC